MILDNSTVMADALSTTTSVASTDYIDTLAAGNAYVGAWVVVRVDDAFVAGAGAPAIQFELQTSPATNFTDVGTATLAVSNSFLVAALTADTIVARMRIPPGAKRYLRVYKNITNYAAQTIFLSSGSWDAYVAADVDVNEIPGNGA